MPQLVTLKLADIKTAPQVRKHFDEADLRRLGESIQAVGLLQPLLVRKDMTLLAGERRLRAMLLVGIQQAQAIITERELSEQEIRVIQLTENVHRADLTGWEKFVGVSELVKLHPDMTQKDLAEKVLHLDPASVTRILSPARCIPAAQEALKANRISISDCYALSKVSETEQERLLDMKLRGASRDQLEAAGRKARSNGQTQAVKLARVRCPLSAGTVVTVSGAEMDLDGVIEALTGALEAARRANKEGLDVKTLERVMRDKAKVAG